MTDVGGIEVGKVWRAATSKKTLQTEKVCCLLHLSGMVSPFGLTS